jgi:hypothetical protein
VEFFSVLNSAGFSSVHLQDGRARLRGLFPSLLGSTRRGVTLALEFGSGLIGFSTGWCQIRADLQDRGVQEGSLKLFR